jgi:peptide/nickel transport system substrate-binding protein
LEATVPRPAALRRIAAALALLLPAASLLPTRAAAQASDGIAMHGAARLAPGDPLPYVDPGARQGGRIVFGMPGSFDNLNVLIPRGARVPALRDPLYGNLVYESLLERNMDEPFSLYPLLAQSVTMPQARDSVTFRLNPAARFSDGAPVTAADVVFSLELLREKGFPFARTYYAKVEAIETPDPATVVFRFPNAHDRELPLILGLMPVLPKHATDRERFGETTMTPTIGSGPYLLAGVAPGRSFTLRRNPDYWGRSHPKNLGRYNADEVRFDYFRDEAAMFEAFKGGATDVFLETDPGHWASAYDFPAARDGRVVKREVPVSTPRGMYAFVFNTRRPPFDDIRVRQALNLLFDWPYVNANLFFGKFKRTASFFEASELSAVGKPASAGERALLAPFPDAVAPAVMEGTYAPSVSDGSGRDRAKIREALALLGEAGFRIAGGKLVDPAGKPLRFEILVTLRDDERLALAFARLLAPVGIEASVRYVDAGQYNARLIGFDFDMARVYWPASLSPGNEQIHRWTSKAADQQGSFNYAGAREPAIDALIAAMLAAEERPAFVDAVHALDRVLISGVYVVPLYHNPVQWVAHAARVVIPQKQAISGVQIETWWVK